MSDNDYPAWVDMGPVAGEPDYGCPACGEPSDYCQGHGEIGDPLGYRILEMHDSGDHAECHPDGCEETDGRSWHRPLWRR